MIRKYIEDQLNNTAYCDFSNGYKQDGYLILEIPRYAKTTFDPGKSYNVSLDPSIMSKDCALSSNWNKGTAPISDRLSVYVEKAQGNMIYVDATEYGSPDGTAAWMGWLPVENIKIIK